MKAEILQRQAESGDLGSLAARRIDQLDWAYTGTGTMEGKEPATDLRTIAALFTTTLVGAMLGIASLGVAFSGYLFAPLARWERWWVAIVSFLFIAPGLSTLFVGLIAMTPIVWRQIQAKKDLALSV